MSIQSGEVFILKALTDDDDGVSYGKVLEDAGFTPKIIPVLDFAFCNLELLKEQLEKPHDYSGIIFSSPRAVKAIVKSLGSAENVPSAWHKHPMFVVGNATKRTLMSDLGLNGLIGSTENAAGLAEVITERKYDHPLLFPCSDIRRDTLPVLLTERGITLKEINVYSTQPNVHLEDLIKATTRKGTVFPEYVVFFSPSGVKYTIPILKKLNAPLNDIKALAIGNTTASALEEAKVEVWSFSSKPSPQSLLDTLLGKT